jgi:signal transduction histidine kinase
MARRAVCPNDHMSMDEPHLNPADPVRASGLQRLQRLRQQDWLALMLLGLHAALVFGIDTPISKAFLLFHFGCFLLWQPVWQGEQAVYVGQALFILSAAALLVASESWWLMALWICVLFALIGGEVPGIKNVGQRIVALIAATYLLSILLMWVVPHLFARQDYGSLFMSMVRYGPFALLGVIFFAKAERAPRQTSYSVDLVYSLLLFLMVVVLVLGAFVIRELSHGDYVVALAQALLVIAGILVVVSWLWDPRAGFAGIGQLMNRYFMSVGMPFERWMHSLANLADQERDPDKFVMAAAQDMAALPWVSGIDWETPNQRGMAGHITRHATSVQLGMLKLTLYTRWSPSPTLVLHIRLLARLLADYHEAKQREQEQRRHAYMHAIYETGSRVTHDVKNLLQSLGSLCAAVESSSEADAAALRRLLQRQLPQVARRLEGTLDKLNRRPDARPPLRRAQSWWRELQQRYAHEGVAFETSGIPGDAELPVDIFDSAADNFLQNSLAKRRAAPGLDIHATLDYLGSGPVLSVCDSGEPLSEQLVRQLFSIPVESAQGFGVGLYQAARLADQGGYRLALSSNVPGRVSFTLCRTEAPAVMGAGPPKSSD